MKSLLPIVLFLSGIANAADTPVSASYREFSGGINNYTASVSLQPNESPDLMNVVVDEPLGSLTQRNGYQTCGTIPSGNTATNLYEYAKNDGSRNLIVTDNVTIWQTADCVVFATIATGLSDQALPRFATVLDNLWIVNGSTWPIVWDGSTATYLDGSGTKPSAPKGRYISYWKSRVWIANTPTAPSSVYFSLLVDANGNILDPATSSAAWTSTNQIYINRDDGSPVYGIKPYRDNLYAFKETGVTRIVFESEYSLSIAKNVTTIGSKFQESIVEMDDGLLRYVGRDGVYAFDGSTVKRLSTRWTPIFESIKQPTRNEQYKLWDSDNDWINGEFSSTTYKHEDGSISLNYDMSKRLREKFGDTTSAFYPSITFSGDNYFKIVGSPSQSLNYYTPTSIGNRKGFIYVPKEASPIGVLTTTGTASFSIVIGAGHIAGLYKSQAVEHFFLNDSQSTSTLNGFSISASIGISGGASVGDNVTYTITTSLNKYVNGTKTIISTNTDSKTNSYSGGNKYCSYNGTAIISYSSASVVSSGSAVSIGECGTNVISDIFSGVYSGTTGVNVDYRTGYIDSMEESIYGTASLLGYLISPSAGTITSYDPPAFFDSGTYTSEISTATGLSLWKTFDTDQTLNGQTIAHQIRTGATPAAVSAAAWRDISPGAVVSTTTEGYAQWKAAFSTTDNSVSPLLNSASIGWITGDTSKSAIQAINYKSRYWMAASTTTGNQYNDLVMVESKSPIGTHTRYDLPISAMVIWNNNLYGAIGNTAKIARLDYGSTDDGAAITSYWTSRDDVYDNPILYKTINTGILDYSNTPANSNVLVGLSPDFGATWQNLAVNIGASTLPRNTYKLNYNANTALGFRTRIFNNTLGVGFKIYGLHNFGKATNFYGN